MGENMSLYNLSVTQQGTCCSSGCGMMEWRFLYDEENRFAIDYTPEFMYRLGLPQLDANIAPEAAVSLLEELLQSKKAAKRMGMKLSAEKVKGEALENIGPLFRRAYDLREAPLEDLERKTVAVNLKNEMTKLGYLDTAQVGCSEL